MRDHLINVLYDSDCIHEGNFIHVLGVIGDISLIVINNDVEKIRQELNKLGVAFS